jgi:hypothetical protein
MQKEVTARAAAGQCQGGARIDDAGSGHALSTEANAVPKGGPVISATCRPHRGGFGASVGARHSVKSQRNPDNPCRVWRNVGRISGSLGNFHVTWRLLCTNPWSEETGQVNVAWGRNLKGRL